MLASYPTARSNDRSRDARIFKSFLLDNNSPLIDSLITEALSFPITGLSIRGARVSAARAREARTRAVRKHTNKLRWRTVAPSRLEDARVPCFSHLPRMVR